MSDLPSRGPGGRDAGGVPDELLLELNFVPEWARRDVGANPYAARTFERRDTAEAEREPRAGRPGGGRYGDRRSDRRSDRGGDRRGDRRGPRRGERPERGGGRGAERAPRPVPAARLPIKVSFLADRAHVGTLVREIRRTGKAYPLIEMASLMMQKAEHYMVKLEAQPSDRSPSPMLHQCKVCRAVFLQREALKQHLVSRHLDDVFEVRDVEGEPPRGNFLCVCRCGLTGLLLGPPNYHGYQARLQEVLHSRFPDMSMEEYRRNIQTLREPELIEQWKNENRTQRVYLRRGEAEGGETLSFDQARQEFQRLHLESRMAPPSARVILPATAAQGLEDGDLLRAIREAWAQEIRFPLTLAFALRPAFRHMGLHLFKANRKANFVIPVEPRPLDPAHAIPAIADLLRYLHEHPGCTRETVLHDLYPGAGEDAPQVVELNQHLRWLIEKGHVIHFYTGALSVPTSAHRADSRARPERAERAVESPIESSLEAPEAQNASTSPDVGEAPAG